MRSGRWFPVQPECYQCGNRADQECSECGDVFCDYHMSAHEEACWPDDGRDEEDADA